MRLKDDEAYMLGASQATGQIVILVGMSKDRANWIRGHWYLLGWLLPSGKLTPKGLSAKGAKPPPDAPDGVLAGSEVRQIVELFEGECDYLDKSPDEEKEANN